ncbi:Uncharacterized protein APZ42_009699, partial [Daphnia magna]
IIRMLATAPPTLFFKPFFTFLFFENTRVARYLICDNAARFQNRNQSNFCQQQQIQSIQANK